MAHIRLFPLHAGRAAVAVLVLASAGSAAWAEGGAQGLTAPGDSLGNGWLGWIGRSVSDAYVTPRADTRLHLGLARPGGVPSLRPATSSASADLPGVWVAQGAWFAGAGLTGSSPVLAPAPGLPGRVTGDLYTLSGGYQWRDRQSLSLQVVRDQRPGAEQRAVSLVYGSPMAADQWLRVGVSSITGFAAGVPVQRIGLSVGYDWPRYFVQLAYDPKTGLLAQDGLLRISAGTRF